MKPLVVPERWTRITDPELCWMAMVAAREGKPFFFGLRLQESGGLDLFSFRNGRSFVAQRSLAGWVKGQRFVVVWSPEELDRPPEVYFDPTRGTMP